MTTTRKATDKEFNNKAQKKEDFEKRWEFISAGVEKLFQFIDSDMTKQFEHKEYVLLYTAVYDLCTSKVESVKPQGNIADMLYERYQKTIDKYLSEVVVPTLNKKQGDIFFSEIVKKWRQHKIIVRWMRKLFGYLDIYYTKNQTHDSLEAVGMKRFLEIVYGTFKKDLAAAILAKIYQERVGEIVDRNQLKDGIQLFIEMGLGSLDTYVNDFESILLQETSTFYRREAANWASEDSCPSFMKKAEDRLFQEQGRAKAYLYSSTEAPLMRTVQFELISTYAVQLMEMEGSGLQKLLEDFKTEDLARMYRLFHRVSHLKPMGDTIRKFIIDEGMKVLKLHQGKEELDPMSYVNDLLSLQKKYSQLIATCFEKDSLFLEAMKDAFSSFVNIDLERRTSSSGVISKTSTSELLSTFVDLVMKSPEKFDDIDGLFDQVVRLFGYISDKDQFGEYERRLLMKRLLVSKTNPDIERSFISKLKLLQGASYTSKLEGMIRDSSLSDDLQKQFKEYLQTKNIKLEMDFYPQVLTTGYWPQPKTDPLNINNDFQFCLKAFRDFYDSRTQARTLKWVHSLGTCQILGNFDEGQKDISASCYQACILLLFNDHKEMQFQDIQRALDLPMDELKKSLVAMTMSKTCKLLNSTGKQNAAEMEDVYTVNMEFSSKARKIKIPNVVLKITERESEEIDKTIQEDRKHSIEASIVRIMKTRKQMTHQDLVMEVSRQLMSHFKPDPKEIKRRIEDLIVREYMERDEQQAKAYKYLA